MFLSLFISFYFIFLLFWLDPNEEFSSDNLADPTITFVGNGTVDVSLLCKSSILNKTEKRKDVTYRIEWLADGKSVKNDSKCDGPLGEKPCQSVWNATIQSILEPSKYKIGQRVSLWNIIIMFALNYLCKMCFV